MNVRPKKQLGQHFLHNTAIAARIVASLDASAAQHVVEIGPGMGVLTRELWQRFAHKFWAVEIDNEAVAYLNANLPQLASHLLNVDFLTINIAKQFPGTLAVIGNLPYNISSQIFFKILDFRNQVGELVAMVQHEVAHRIASNPGSRNYGILSVLLQAYFRVNYLFAVEPDAFVPPPKVKSAVIRLQRNDTEALNCNESLFFQVVKAAFNQRRKTLRNAIAARFPNVDLPLRYARMRAEQLAVNDFVEITQIIDRAPGR